MPTIELQKRRTNSDRQYKPKEQNLWAQECYSTALWRRLRKSYLMKHPLCEIHLMDGKIKASECAHHINEISNAGSRMEAWDIAFDSKNLMALCNECHQRYHSIMHSGHPISGEDLVFLNKYKELCNKKSGNQ